MRIYVLIALLCGSCLALMACGQKGPLYFPEEQTPKPPQTTESEENQ